MPRPYVRKQPHQIADERIRAAKLLYENGFSKNLIEEMTGIDRVTLWRMAKQYEWKKDSGISE